MVYDFLNPCRRRRLGGLHDGPDHELNGDACHVDQRREAGDDAGARDRSTARSHLAARPVTLRDRGRRKHLRVHMHAAVTGPAVDVADELPR